MYDYIKALHLIFVITWFAGLFYVPRLFVNQIEVFHKPSPEKEILGEHLKLMTKRLWFIITWPSAILATIFAIWLLILPKGTAWLYQSWMHVKLFFVLLLYIYHWQTHRYYKQLQKDIVKKTSNYMRIWNEGATFILFAIVFLVILKSEINWIFGIIGLIILGVLIMLGYKLYQRARMRKNSD